MVAELSRRLPSRGDVIAGTYVLGETLGAGGMGVVFAADREDRQRVAIKLLHPDHEGDDSAVRRLHSEAVAASYISHVNVVSVFDFSEPGAPAPFVVMEHVDGVPLGTLLRRHGPLPVRRASNIARQILAGLDAAHSAGIVHADIKSDNIMVERGPDGAEVVKIIDFGLATIRRPDHPAPVAEYDPTGRLLMSGTPEYMAPEVIRGHGPVPASDLYGVGVIIYEMLTGHTPFGHGPSAAILEKHLSECVVPPSMRCPDRGIPIALDRVVMRALEKTTSARYSTAAEFAALLAAATPPTDVDRATHDPAPDAFSTESRTLDFAAGTPRSQPAPALTPEAPARSTERLRKLRSELADALERDASDDAAVRALTIARTLVDEHRLWAAVRELEDAITSLTRGTGEAEQGPPPTWRLLLTLSALYHQLGDRKRALRAASNAQRHATYHQSAIGCERAEVQLTRLAWRRAR
jgi:serine/threonine-protein kinase